MNSMSIDQLIKASHSAKLSAYNPYSNFRVGAALLTTDGRIFTGCNVENSSFGLTICAERCAIVKAVSEGCTSFQAIAISSDLSDECIVPCGACRQVIIEFAPKCQVYMTKPDGSYKLSNAMDLLPDGFTPNYLKLSKITT